MDLYLVRHAQSKNNVLANEVPALADGTRLTEMLRFADPPLSAKGEKQAGALGDWVAASANPTAAALRRHAEQQRLVFFTSPQRRCLLTSKGLARGLRKLGKYADVVVLANGFEEGGARVEFPALSGMAGLEQLQKCKGKAELDAIAEPLRKQTQSPGISASHVLDPVLLAQYLDEAAPVQLVSRVEPAGAMTRGWWGGKRRETRLEALVRAEDIAARFVRMAAEGEADCVVFVAHGDLMDLLLKCLLAGPPQKRPATTPTAFDRTVRFDHANTGITHLSLPRSSDGRRSESQPIVFRVNQCSHLEATAAARELLSCGTASSASAWLDRTGIRDAPLPASDADFGSREWLAVAMAVALPLLIAAISAGLGGGWKVLSSVSM